MSGTPDITKAKKFALCAHAGQLYNDEVPYSVHLESVVGVLARFGYSRPALVCAAWLHDSIEDTTTSYNDIKKRFGEDVAELVYAVTSELGRNRAERNRKTYPKLQDAGIKARLLKLADRIANVEYGMATGGKNDMYAKEFPEFEARLRYAYPQAMTTVRDPELEPLWAYLERLLGEKP